MLNYLMAAIETAIMMTIMLLPEARWFFAAGLHIRSCYRPSWTDSKLVSFCSALPDSMTRLKRQINEMQQLTIWSSPAAFWCSSSSSASPRQPWTSWGPRPPCCSTPVLFHLHQMPGKGKIDIIISKGEPLFKLNTFSYFSLVLARVVSERVSWAWIRAPSCRNCKATISWMSMIIIIIIITIIDPLLQGL